MVEAYVLIQTEVGKPPAVVSKVNQIRGVVTAEVVAGPYDVIARVTAVDVDSLARLVVSKIQTVDGVTRTLTCSVIHL